MKHTGVPVYHAPREAVLASLPQASAVRRSFAVLADRWRAGNKRSKRAAEDLAAVHANLPGSHSAGGLRRREQPAATAARAESIQRDRTSQNSTGPFNHTTVITLTVR